MAIYIGRREFIATLGGAAATWPLAARAQQTGKLQTIGFFGALTSSAASQWTSAFVQRLRELGWIEGRNITIEYRWLGGRTERASEIADEFVRLKVDVIVTHATAPVLAAKQATSVSRKSSRRLPARFNVGNPSTVLDMDEAQAAAKALGLEITALEIRRSEDIAPAFDALKGRAEALYVCGNTLTATNRIRINTLAVAARLPTMHGGWEFVEAGGLMSYAPSFPNHFRRAADFVDKILRGAKPADIPVEQPTKFDFAINLTTAKALGLEMPPTLLARADEVIE